MPGLLTLLRDHLNILTIPRKHLPIRPLKLPHNSISPPARPRRDTAPKILRTREKALRIPRLRIRINRHHATIPITFLSKIKTPKQLCSSHKHLAFRQMDTWTDAPSSAIDIVISIHIVRRRRIISREFRLPCKTAWIEFVRVWKDGFVVVETLDIEEDGGAFGQGIAVHDIVFCQRVRKAEGSHWTPADGLFDNHADVREAVVVGPVG